MKYAVDLWDTDDFGTNFSVGLKTLRAVVALLAQEDRHLYQMKWPRISFCINRKRGNFIIIQLVLPFAVLCLHWFRYVYMAVSDLKRCILVLTYCIIFNEYEFYGHTAKRTLHVVLFVCPLQNRGFRKKSIIQNHWLNSCFKGIGYDQHAFPFSLLCE